MSRDIHVVIEQLRGQVADISFVALAAARQLALGTEGDVVALLLGHEADHLAAGLAADRVWYVGDPGLAQFTPEPYVAVLTELYGENDRPRAVLFGDTSIGAEVAGGLSGRLDLPLVSRCRRVEASDGVVGFTSEICGGKILVEGELPEPTALVTMVPGGYRPEEGRSSEPPEVMQVPAPVLGPGRISLRSYHEPAPGDVDIGSESILIAVGRGIEREENLKLVEDLALAIGGAVCASRPVVDQGWLPTTRLVGKSGRRVKPKAYLALGISGAPEHVEGMTDSELVIAVNTDPMAPIFGVAQYGAETDVVDLLPLMLSRVGPGSGSSD